MSVKHETEWIVVWFLTGFSAIRSLVIFDNTNDNAIPNNNLLYIFFVCILLMQIAAAKANLYNIFRDIRSIPKVLKKFFNHLWLDYKIWRITGKRL